MGVAERRRWPRLDVELHVVMRFTRTEDVLRARSLNISRRGIYLATDQMKPLGTTVHLTIELDEERERMEIAGIVVHEVPEDEDSRPRGLGIFLTETPPAWEGFCSRLERARTESAVG